MNSETAKKLAKAWVSVSKEWPPPMPLDARALVLEQAATRRSLALQAIIVGDVEASGVAVIDGVVTVLVITSECAVLVQFPHEDESIVAAHGVAGSKASIFPLTPKHLKRVELEDESREGADSYTRKWSFIWEDDTTLSFDSRVRPLGSGKDELCEPEDFAQKLAERLGCNLAHRAGGASVV